MESKRAKQTAAAAGGGGGEDGEGAQKKKNNQAAVSTKALELEADLSKLKLMRGRKSLAEGDALTILIAYLQMKLDAVKSQRARSGSSGGGSVTEGNVQVQVARLLGRSSKTVSKVWRHWKATGKVYVGSSMGNFAPKATRIPATAKVKSLIQRFVRDCAVKRQRVTASQVRDMLVKHGVLSLAQNDKGVVSKKDQHAAAAAVQRMLHSLGYTRDAKANVALRGFDLAQRQDFCRRLLMNRALPAAQRMRQVYLDEHVFHNPADKTFVCCICTCTCVSRMCV